MAGAFPSVFLIGYRGSGKSTVGRLVAERLQRRLVDTDDLVVGVSGMSIARCFAEAGESVFRKLESDALESVCRRIDAGERLVVATGGGIVLRPANAARMRNVGLVVWLSAPAAALRQRIARDPGSAESRPALTLGGTTVEEVEDVLRAREPLYRAAALLEVPVESCSPEDAADRILEELAKGRGPEAPGGR